ncbi:hypothetical protein LXA43DRAFT_890569 [Ganoderma leucocontextum]|nr:hypothetical protein LXA43DRAFT_890569 [Ganoderma leucocontextum]
MDRKQVRFKRSSTPPRSSRPHISKPIGRYLPTLQTISLLILLLIIVSIIGFNSYLFSFISAAIDFTTPFVDTASASLARAPGGQVPPHIAEYVQRAISTALGTTLQRPNFALRSRGAIILPSLTTSPVDSSCEPEDILEEVHSSQPCCFFAGDRGQFAIRLSQLIRPTHVTIDYPPPTRTMSRRAPRQLVLWGLVDGAANKALFNSLAQFRDDYRSLGDGPLQSGPFLFLPLANFTFDVHGAFPIQTFPVHPEIVFSGIRSGLYVLEVRSNWGGELTGIRRVGLHGEEVP